MFILSGIPVSSGISIGRAFILAHALSEIESYKIEDSKISSEVKRFKKALENQKKELAALKKQLSKNNMKEYSSFVDIHLSILNDPKISKDPINIIEQNKINAEWSIKMQMDEIIKKFNKINNSYIREKE